MKVKPMDIEEYAWTDFATVYPHECYRAWPERFWEWFHQKHPGIARPEMERLLRESACEERI